MTFNTLLTRSLPAGAVTGRNCLRTRPLRGHLQTRWLGTKYIAKVMKADEEWAVQAEEIRRGKRTNLFDELDERGFIKDIVGTKELLRETMRRKRITAYTGVDPTASSLHLGHVLAFMPIFWMYQHGYGGITLIGGSTAKVGDPTGRTESRPALKSAQLTQNLASIHHQLKALWGNVEALGLRFGRTKDWASTRAIVNNNHWWNKQPLLEVMRRLGNHVRLGPMLGRDHVKTRLAEGSGMSFSELTYPLMQGWDWFELFRQRGVQWQIGGSDQYGNILTGAECVKTCVKTEPDKALMLPSGTYEQPMGFTVPLLTDPSGAKFGKSAGNAIWLDPFQTTPFDLYGYLVRRSDDDVEKLLKLFTFHSLDNIDEIVQKHREDPRQRVAQHTLAHEVTWLVHGKHVADQVRKQHQSVYGTTVDLTAQATESSGPISQEPEQYRTRPNEKETLSATNRPRIDIQLPRHVLLLSLPRIVYACGLATSVSDADRSIKAGGVYLGGEPGGGIKYQKGMTVGQLQFVPCRAWNPEENTKFLIDDKILLVRKGKHNLRCIELISDAEWNEKKWTYPGQRYNGQFRKAMNLLNESTAAAKKKKEETGKLAEEDKIDPLASDPSLRLSDRARRTVNQARATADKDGLVRTPEW